jgi:FAD/FMN-containing dehydrogenase
MTHPHESWGRYPQATPVQVMRLDSRSAPLPATTRPMLVYGNGRSYGDVCLNDGGELLLSRGLDRFIAFDHHTGRLRAEAGVLLSEILELCVPRGWFLPVTPGTCFITLGGAVANDVHGKNHHRAGTFGCHVRAFELVRSDGSRRICSPTESADWFAATIGGLGLTGLIAWVEIQLCPIEGPWIQTESRRFTNLDAFLQQSDEADQRHEFTVAWVDCAARGRALGRGVFMRGNFAPQSAGTGQTPTSHGRLGVPLTPPMSLINHLSLRTFNALYYRKPEGSVLSHYAPFFYPLDSVGHWNRIYGPKGFLQYQCVLPPATAKPGLYDLLERIARSGQGSFLAVLKRFGERRSPGMLSFPRPGVTIALDFPFKGQATLRLLDALDALVSEAGGALYPAKDARMSPAMFRQSFPALEQFLPYRDPQFSSGFWRRACGVAPVVTR